MNLNEASKLNVNETSSDSSQLSNKKVILQTVKERKTLRLIYFFCLFVLCSILVVQLQKAIRYYLSYPTYTKSHLVRQSDAEFPALSICSDTTNYNENVLQVRATIINHIIL